MNGHRRGWANRMLPGHGRSIGLRLSVWVALGFALASPASAKPAPWQVPVHYPASTALASLHRSAFIRAGILAHDFAKPAQNWLPGHRGIDLVPTGAPVIVAPSAGSIGFVGNVAGKPVVTLLHAGGLRSTFEPAETDLVVGTVLDAGDFVGTISSAGPWHCPTACLHWGVKDGDEYLDPWRFIRPPVRIILLPGPHARG